MLSTEIMQNLEQYLSAQFVSEAQVNYDKECSDARALAAAPVSTKPRLKSKPSMHPDAVKNYIDANKGPTFTSMLLQYIDQSGETDVEIYKKAGVDRRLFSKIRNMQTYKPRKQTVVALTLALELSMLEAETFLCAAGHALSISERWDLVVKFCLENQIYDIDSVNQAFNHFQLTPLLGVV